MAEMVPVREYFDRVSADLAASSLQAAGMHAVVMGDDMGGLRPDLGIIGRVRVLVPEPELSEAKALLDEFERNRPQLVDFPDDDEEDSEAEKSLGHRGDGPAQGADKRRSQIVMTIILILIGIVVLTALLDR